MPKSDHESPRSKPGRRKPEGRAPRRHEPAPEPPHGAEPATSEPEGPERSGGFAELGLAPELLATLTALGYEEPTPIQRAAIPALLGGRDLLGQAATGTGKTAAFALPMLQAAIHGGSAPHRPRALVLVPTRELAMQVAEAVHRYGKQRDASVLPIYGGQPIGRQLRALERGVDVVVATPGRALDHLERGTLELGDVRMVVLDEADEMLDMGFAEDIEAILGRSPEQRQTALFSATLPARIVAIAGRHLRDPARISIARERTPAGELPRVRQVAYVVPRAQKHAALGRVLDLEMPSSAIVFCRTRLEVDELAEAMSARGHRADALHGGFLQEQRDRVMKRFRSGQSELLVATDVAARGLDVEHVTHVVNYDVPSEPEAYVHRIGRTGRAGREGVAITFVEPREHRLLRNIQQATDQKIQVSHLPTVADLRRRRLELTRASLQQALVGRLAGDETGEEAGADELEPYRALVAELAEESDPMDVAAAAVKIAHEATHAIAEGGEDELLDRAGTAPDRRGEGRPPRGEREREPRARPPRREDRGSRGGWDTVRLYIGSGRVDGIRPADLVGAIANEAGVRGDAIGAIEIADRFALVEVPADAAEHVIRALRGTKLRGRRPIVRRDRET